MDLATVAVRSVPDWSFHADRETIVSEPHARPSMPVSSGDLVLHMGLTCKPAAQLRLFEILNLGSEAQHARHWMKQSDQYRLKFEQHTEFISITLLFPEAGSAAVPPDLLNKIADIPDIEAIILTKVQMTPVPIGTAEATPFSTKMFGGTMRGGMDVRSSLVPDESGFITYSVHSESGAPEEVGRRIQRLIEMETYRTLCLLGLPLARRAGGSLAESELRLIDVVNSMSTQSAEDDEKLFEKLSRLLQESGALRASTRFRFGASTAYYNLVLQRLTSLEEAKLDDLQTISGFVRSRLDPGIATIESVASRQKTLIDDLSQALSQLRTRIDLALNRDNQSLLKSLDARHRQQVLIAQTVEGLSAVAITYYAVGLLSYVLKGAAPILPAAVPHSVVLAFSVPFVVSAVWMSLHHLRAKWDKHE